MKYTSRLCIVLSLAIPAPSVWGSLSGDDLFGMNLEELLDVKISIASKTPESTMLSAGTVYIVSESEIKAFGWRDLREILAAVPMFSGTRNFDWYQVSLRGGGANMVKLLIDGREIQNLIADEALIQDSFPAHRIKRVEILMGSHSTLYGSNAADGVINIVTKHGAEGDGNINQFQVIRGEADTSQLSMVMNHTSSSGQFGVSVSTFESNYNWQELTSFTQNNDLWSRRDTGQVPDYSNPIDAPYRSYSIGAYGEVNDVYFGANAWEDSGPQGYNEVFAFWGERRSIRKFDQWFIGSNFQLADMTGFAEYIYIDEEDLFLEPDWNGSLEPKRHHVKIEASTSLGEHNLVFGYDAFVQETVFRNDAVANGGSGVIHSFPASKVEKINTHKHSLFAQDTYFLTEKLKGVLGLRVDSYKDVDTSLTPRAGLVYSFSEDITARLTYGGGFRAPNGFDLVRAKNGGVQDLAPIESDMLELGFSKSIKGDSWHVFNNFSVYRYQIEGNYIIKQLTGSDGAPGEIIITPDDSAEVFGLENLTKFEFDEYSGSLALRYSNPDEVTVADSEVVKDIPKFKLKASLAYRHSDSFSLGVFLEHWSDVHTEANLVDVEGTEVHQISAWTRVDLNMVFGDYQWGENKVNFAIRAENITNEEYFHALRGNSPYQVMQPPRHIRFTVNVDF